MDPYGHYQQNIYAANNRVYINRNFNRNNLETVPTLTNTNVMYFNPNFAQTISSYHNDAVSQRVDTVRPKIHVNPNFIRTRAPDVSTYIAQASTSSLLHVPRVTTIYTQPSLQQTQFTVSHNPPQISTVSKSRYCLVRQNEKVIKPPASTSVPGSSTLQTVKINKYKLVSLNSVKKSMVTTKPATTKLVLRTPVKLSENKVVKTKYKIRIKATPNHVPSSRYKYVRRNSSIIKVPETLQGTVRRISITHNRSILKTSFSQNKKIVRGALKKNNIPCPLFKKFGKCLRLMRGNCDFLHDKKHVSICRKFLKGACHNENCLLSHDLTDKKMPTCYFYLQGICTKEGCPYLHVKLNEKAKICPDFLKGYCERGDKCTLRHVNVTPKKSSKVVKSRKFYSSVSLNKSFKIEKSKIQRRSKSNIENNREDKSKTQDTANDQRYFRDVAESSNTTVDEQCDVIKPTRCKLGTLPSFIQI